MKLPSVVSPSDRPKSRAWFVWFVLAEVLCLGGFVLGLVFRRPSLAAAALLLPLHLALVVVLFRSDYHLLAFFSALFPLSGLELLPHVYREFGLFLGVLGLLAIVMLTDSVTTRNRRSRRTDRTVATLLVVIVLTAVVADAVAVLRGSGIRVSHTLVLIVVLLAVWVYATVPESIRHVRRLAYLLVGVYALSFVFLPLLLRSTGYFVTTKVFTSLFGRPNFNLVGMIAAACCGILLGMVLDAKGWKRAALLAASVVVLAVVLYSRSRGAWFGFAICFLYILVRARSLKLLLVAAAVVAVLLSLDVFRFAFQVRAEQTSAGDPALLGRFVLWRTAWNAFRSNWLIGIGVENFRYLKTDFGFPTLTMLEPKFRHGTHNLFIEQFVGLGAVGGMAFLVLPLIAVARLNRLANRTARGSPRGLLLGLSAGVIAYGSHCLLDSPSWNTSTFVLWGVLLGLAFAAVRVVERAQVRMHSATTGSRP